MSEKCPQCGSDRWWAAMPECHEPHQHPWHLVLRLKDLAEAHNREKEYKTQKPFVTREGLGGVCD